MKKICAGFDWEPQKCFSDKLLLFTAPEGAEFRHDEKEKFVPREIKVDQVNRIYVIPPISIDVIDSLKKGAQIATGNDDGWNVVYNKSENHLLPSVRFAARMAKTAEHIPISIVLIEMYIGCLTCHISQCGLV